MRITVKELRTLIAESVAEAMDEMKTEETVEEVKQEEAVEECSAMPENLEEVILEAYRAGLLEGRKKKAKAAKKLTPSQKEKLDKNKDGKIDAKDFKMLRDEKKETKVSAKKPVKK